MRHRLLFFSTLGAVAVGVSVLSGVAVWPYLQEYWAIRRLVWTLKSDKPSAAWNLLPDLRRMDAGQPAVLAVLPLLENQRPEVRQWSASVCQYFAPEAGAAIDKLINRMNDPTEVSEVRHCCIRALSRIGRYRPEAVSAVIKRLEDEDEIIRMWATQHLAELGAPAKEASPVFIHALHSEQRPYTRHWAAVALGEIGSESDNVIAALTTAVKDENYLVRQSAVIALGKIGPPARAAQETLREAMSDDQVSHLVSWALGRIEPKEPHEPQTK